MLRIMLIIFTIIELLIICLSIKSGKPVTGFLKLNKLCLNSILKFIRHPISLIKIIISVIMYTFITITWVVVGFIEFLFLALPLVYAIVAIVYTVVTKGNALFCILSIIITFLLIMLSPIHSLISKITHILEYYLFYLCAYLHQLFKNIIFTEYEKIFIKPISEKISPKEWAIYNKKITEERSKQRDIERENRRKGVQTKQKIHKRNEIDIYYAQELMLFGLYEKDFTLDELKKSKNQLLKKWHPDNTINDSEKENYTRETEKINNYYLKLRNAVIKFNELYN